MSAWHSLNSSKRGLFFLILFLAGCGYHFDTPIAMKSHCTFSVPYIAGDEKGCMTSALIKEITARLPLRYATVGGDLLFTVTLVEREKTNIGYRLAPKKEVDNKEVVVAEEGRLVLTATVVVTEKMSCRSVFGPIEVSQSLTFDFEPDFSNIDDHTLSLGQLEMESLAEEVALSSLQKLLAQKIVDSLLYSW